MAKRALDDLVVVEFAQMVSGPMCGKMFADMGAEVIKIEPPRIGDEMRAHPPFPGDIPHPEKSGSFLYLNTSKKSFTLDPATSAGAEVFKKLIARADVLIENHPPGYLDNIGLGFDALHAVNSRLIVTSITPFGQVGPYRDWKGTDLIEFAMSLTGYNTPTMVDDAERENPLRAPGHQAEMMGATAAAAASMFAIFHREATGEGQWIDVPCWQAIASTSKIEMAAVTYAGVPFSRMRGNVATGLEPLPCKDGYIYTLWAADTHYTALKILLHCPPEMESEVFDKLAGRQANDDVLRPMIREELLKYDTEYLVTEGQRLGLTIGPVFTVAQAAGHPHLRARDAFVEIDHPIAGRFEYPRSLVKMTATPPTSSRAPLLGEHSAEILGRLGYSTDEQREMREAGVVILTEAISMARLPLEGIRVADFSWIINGPQIAQWLATMGAEVIKIESQVYVDIGRINPAGMADHIAGPNRNGFYHALNYGKKAITLNLANEKGRELADEIIRKSDFVLECFPTPAAKKLGITYERVRAVKPDIIIISVSLLGKTGLEPASWVGWGPMACCFVGMFDAQGYPATDNAGARPRQTGGTWPDYAIASAVTFHVLAALRHRNRTGEGQWIDASMGETVIGQMPEWYMDYFMNGRDRRQQGNRDDVMAPHNTYRCAGNDKWIAIAVGSQSEWESLCHAMGDPEWTRDAKFADQQSRCRHSDELDTQLAKWTRNYEHIALAKDLQRAGVAAGPVLDSVEIHEDPHLWEWGFFRKIHHHEVGERILPNMPVRMSKVPEMNYSMPPDLGQHNREIFGGLLGLSDAEIKILMEQKVIY